MIGHARLAIIYDHVSHDVGRRSESGQRFQDASQQHDSDKLACVYLGKLFKCIYREAIVRL